MTRDSAYRNRFSHIILVVFISLLMLSCSACTLRNDKQSTFIDKAVQENISKETLSYLQNNYPNDEFTVQDVKYSIETKDYMITVILKNDPAINFFVIINNDLRVKRDTYSAVFWRRDARSEFYEALSKLYPGVVRNRKFNAALNWKDQDFKASLLSKSKSLPTYKEITEQYPDKVMVGLVSPIIAEVNEDNLDEHAQKIFEFITFYTNRNISMNSFGLRFYDENEHNIIYTLNIVGEKDFRKIEQAHDILQFLRKTSGVSKLEQ